MEEDNQQKITSEQILSSFTKQAEAFDEVHKTLQSIVNSSGSTPSAVMAYSINKISDTLAAVALSGFTDVGALRTLLYYTNNALITASVAQSTNIGVVDE